MSYLDTEILKLITKERLIVEASLIADSWQFKPSTIHPAGLIYENRVISNIIKILSILKCVEKLYPDSPGLDIYQLSIYFKDIDIQSYLNMMVEHRFLTVTIDMTKKFLSNKIYHINYYS